MANLIAYLGVAKEAASWGHHDERWLVGTVRAGNLLVTDESNPMRRVLATRVLRNLRQLHVGQATELEASLSELTKR
ncbi:MAG: hypothetical protein AB7O97_04100 [Planctomycetota bacterium]